MFIEKGPTAVARFPEGPATFLLYIKGILDKVTGNAALSNVDSAAYATDVKALDDAQTKAEDGSSAAVKIRDAKALKVYRHTLKILRQVQEAADNAPTVADAIALIVGAGFDVRKSGGRKKADFAAKHNGISGEVLLVALAIADSGAYYWEYSLDQVTWTAEPETVSYKTTVKGLTPGKVYYFRFRALTPKGKSDYSQVASLMVH